MGGARQLTVTLSPRELGTVAIQVSRQPSGAASITLLVERPDTLALLRREAPALQSALDRAGTPVLDRHVTMALASNPAASQTLQGGGSGNPAGGDRAPWQRAGTPRGEAGRPADAVPAPAVQPSAVHHVRGGPARAGIDITA
jgi:hypothetical protein